MNEYLFRLCQLHGVSGDEGTVRKYIHEIVKKYTNEIVVDALGNLIVHRAGRMRSDKKIMLCAHMDEVGLIATGFTENGYIKFASVGGIDKRVLPGKRVQIGKTTGVIGVKPSHLTTPTEMEKSVEISDMYIDIGASTREETMAVAAVGDTIMFDPVVRASDENLFAKAIDDRFGCAVLMKLIESELPIDCTFAFTVQEEVGTRGAVTAANRVKPEIAIVLEATTAADLPGVPEAKKVCKLGAGAVLPFMDGGTIYDRELWNMLRSVAEKNEIPWQTKEYISGGTDASVIQRSGSGVKTAGIAAPVRNLHSPICVAKMSDLQAVYDLVSAGLAELAALYGRE